jgi:hypothetical protein
MYEQFKSRVNYVHRVYPFDSHEMRVLPVYLFVTKCFLVHYTCRYIGKKCRTCCERNVMKNHPVYTGVNLIGSTCVVIAIAVITGNNNCYILLVNYINGVSFYVRLPVSQYKRTYSITYRSMSHLLTVT